ncbi:Flp family type IVb pilin [Liberibacter crescens]|uniref:Flp family type IVb pilin n=1 Tax=Liberibacter crescens TaxID=1273132 RepID=UPI000763106B|nr:Flp family type IVb pilin [Liberibacter crescens]AMC13218.1 pilus assembly protein [Liberibacter crescens]
MLDFLKVFYKDESGATAIEYGLIAALVSVALIAGATALGNSISSTFMNLANKMNVSSAIKP